jgi:hypothetical protein
MIVKIKKGTVEHVIDTSQIDELDEIDCDQQLSLTWCETHQTWEWHWLERNV